MLKGTKPKKFAVERLTLLMESPLKLTKSVLGAVQKLGKGGTSKAVPKNGEESEKFKRIFFKGMLLYTVAQTVRHYIRRSVVVW